MSQEVELISDIESTNDNVANVANVIIRAPESQSCWRENKCSILFLFTAALGFVWVGLNLGGFI